MSRTVRPTIRVADVVIAASLWSVIGGLRMSAPQAIGLASAAWLFKIVQEDRRK